MIFSKRLEALSLPLSGRKLGVDDLDAAYS